ncbi:hypothetical protein PRIPAC_71790 [Pristionchus pacificus]|uniref:Peptidase n=1 Tax=Pristionchus pacificus TaxID=54126 RepID=A0A2A6C519_PRIPA|nr:hypothetical protein PRIPAC_71790 [Pristionchus pacificus]|eukprot:PDM73230.1 Peptidase [Pristionchus pacificus]
MNLSRHALSYLWLGSEKMEIRSAQRLPRSSYVAQTARWLRSWLPKLMQLQEKERPRDPCSAANIEHATITHMAIKWDVHFLLQMLDGSVSLHVKLLKESTHVILDARDLYVRSVTVDGIDAEFSITPWHTFRASKLSIALPEEKTAEGTETVIHIVYSTSAAASALQWLKKEQTTDDKAPYLFSQCQPIHARSVVPCMDTPSVKQTYEAEPVAVPSYLLAIVVGALEKREISPRCAIWAEPSIVEKALWEFEETEQILSCAESICGPYVWGRYDMVCLPATFPYGGMENPCLTFVTPTLIAGDRSLVSVVAHEIAHSWSGNLVTNSTWEHFWLNEGFTVCIERKICGRLVSESYRQFMSLNGWRGDLVPTINEHFHPTHPLTKLVQEHKDIDPEMTFSSIHYEKGSAFLLALEQALGTEVFEKYLRAYIAEFSHKAIDSHTWREHLYNYFDDRKDVLDSVNIDAWLFEAGMPPAKPEYDDTMVVECDKLVKEWIDADEKSVKSITSEAYLSMKPLQRIECFSQLWQHDPPLPHYKLEALDRLYSLEECGNFEIQLQWIQLCIKCRWEPIVPRAALTGWPDFADEARGNFVRTRMTMHPITAEIVGEELNIKAA